MTSPQPDFQVTVWTYTYANGPDAGRILFHSPERQALGDSIVLRQASSADADKTWVCGDTSVVVKCSAQSTLADAHGLIIKDGFGKALRPSVASSPGAPLIPYARGERIWVEGSFSEDDDDVPVISLDSLQAFSLPSSEICWVPQMVGSSRVGNQVFALPVGPKTCSKDDSWAQPLVQWPVGQPHMATCRWEQWDEQAEVAEEPTWGIEDWTLRGKGREVEERRGKPARFSVIDDVDVRRETFRQHWDLFSAKLGLHDPRDPSPGLEDGSELAHPGTEAWQHVPRQWEPTLRRPLSAASLAIKLSLQCRGSDAD